MKHAIEAAMFSIALCIAGVSQATVLVSESFPVGAGGYTATAGTTGLKTPTITTNAVFGFEWTRWNNGSSSSSGAVYSFGANGGLSFPACFAEHGFEAVGTSAGYHNGKATEAGYPRVAEKKLSFVMPDSFPTDLYFRCLVYADSACTNSLTKPKTDDEFFTSSTCFAVGLVSEWQVEGTVYDYFFSSSNSLLFAVAENIDGGVELDLCVKDAIGGRSFMTLVDAEHFEAGKTYLCVAKIQIAAGANGAEIVRAAAFDVGAYDATKVIDGFSDPIVSEFWSDSASPGYIGLCGRYQNRGGYFKVDEFVIGTELEDVVYYETGLPIIAASSISKSGDDFGVSVSMKRNSATVKALAYDGVSQDPVVTVLGTASTSAPAEGLLSGLTAGHTYEVFAAAENEAGAETNRVGVVYVGTPQIARTANADETGLVSGSFTVSRADSNAAIPVNYTCGGTAVNGVNYETLSGTVVIPAGASSVEVAVNPLMARPHDAATTLTLTLADGNYIVVDPAPEASLTIVNRAPPAGTNTWVAAEDGLASDASNWSEGRVPVATDDILLDGDFSTANMTWDGATEGMTDSVASWTQLASYTGTVVIATARTGSFTCLTVTGDATLSRGKWTHSGQGNSSTATVWLNVAVNGDLTAASEFTFGCAALGFAKRNSTSGGGEGGGGTGASHGGHGANGSVPGGGHVYGDYRTPTSLGSADYGSNHGGGAVRLDVAGTFCLDGSINVNGASSASYGGSSGGSVLVYANRMTGTGSVTAKGAGSTNNNRYGGGGGRIAIYLRDSAFGHDEFAAAFTGTISAAGGFTTSNSNPKYAPGAAGTVYVETAVDDGKGWMLLWNKTNQDLSKYNPQTAVASVWTNVTWNLSSLELKDNGRVGVKKDGEIHLPSFANLTGDNSDYALVLFDGGVVSSDIKHDTLVADGFGVQAVGVNSFADHTLVIPDTSTLKVSGDFTVGALKLGSVKLDAGDYSAATLRETYSNVSGDGTIHVCGLADGFIIIIR